MITPEQKLLINSLGNINFSELELSLDSLSKTIIEHLDELKKVQTEINTIIDEKSKGFPWLSDKIAEYFEMRDIILAEFLERKFIPAKATAEYIKKELSKEKRILKRECLISKNFVDYYEALFPWLTDYVGDDLDDLIKQVREEENSIDEQDPVLKFIPKAEYKNLSDSERNQIALDRYFASRKFNWQIGRDYERYIGYLYETKEYDVNYQGIELGLQDLGRDLICRKKDVVEIVQCKYWAKHKTIHEKHINQLFGTTIKYYLDSVNASNDLKQLALFPDLLKQGVIKSTFITSTKLSETAKQFALALGIKIIEEFPLKSYPSIKCNISAKGNKIYHLPFDQQYDKTKISKHGECYVTTVAEAEKLGFRRAWKWYSEKSSV